MYQNILVPCDGSPEAVSAAGQAISLAKQLGSTLHVLYVSAPEPEQKDGEFSTRAAERNAVGQRALDEVRERATERDVPVETLVVEGEPVQTIVDTVETVDADLVMMGTHARRGVDRFLSGSVAEGVVRRSPVPVMTIGLQNGRHSVVSPDRAWEIAREQLAIAGHEDAHMELPSRQRSSWVVHAEAGGHEYNVHINSATGRAKLVQIG